MATPDSQLDGKVVIVTGAARGIGAATARLLAGRGARLVLGSRSVAALKAVAESAGGETAYLAADVTRAGDVRALVELASQRFGRLDVFVARRDQMAMSPEAVAYAIAQPDEVDVGEIVVRPTVQP